MVLRVLQPRFALPVAEVRQLPQWSNSKLHTTIKWIYYIYILSSETHNIGAVVSNPSTKLTLSRIAQEADHSIVLHHISADHQATIIMLTEEEVNGMLVNQLKEELIARGASVVGKKAELAGRLLDIVRGAAGSESIADAAVSTAQNNSTVQCNTNSAKEQREELNIATSVAAPAVVTTEATSTPEPLKIVSDASADVGTKDPDEVETSNNEGYTHVRIDNFQRPLNQKALVEWLEKTCQCTLTPDSLWINSIKTHCYVDFNNYEEASRCISKVNGQRYPATSAYTLEADFTSISAKEAPNSAEGARKPGEWKVAPNVSATSNSSEVHAQETKNNAGEQKGVSSVSKPTEPGEEMKISADISIMPAAASRAVPVGSKRRIDAMESTASTVAENAGGTPGDAPEGKSRRVAGLDIFRRATAGILFGNMPGTSAANATSPRHGSAALEAPAETPTVTGFVTRKVRAHGGAESNCTGGDAATAAAAPEGLVLEDLFRKTVRTTPAVYWMPAPDDMVQQRLKSKLLLKSRK